MFAPRRDDADQDHRLIGELASTVWRDSLIMHYEIPKWDGDLGRVTHYVPLDTAVAHHKIELLHECFPSQGHHHWWDDETFLALMRLRGMECRQRYAVGLPGRQGRPPTWHRLIARTTVFCAESERRGFVRNG